MLTEVTIRLANPADRDRIMEFISIHGPNEWQYLPMDEISQFLTTVKPAPPSAFIAERRHHLVGMATCKIETSIIDECTSVTGVVEDVVAHGAPGIGLKLLITAGEHLFSHGAASILVERHEENLLSARICERAGYETIRSYYDPERRIHGSRRTVLQALHRRWPS